MSNSKSQVDNNSPIEPQQPIKTTSSPACTKPYVSSSFNTSNQTGKLMFKFDNDEPQECGTIHDYGKITIELQQQKKLSNNFQFQNNTSIEFISKDGKRFRLFIENCY